MSVAFSRPSRPRREGRNRQTLAASVAEALVAYIIEEGLKDGEFLPSTAELAERFGVSRTVIREAIADLAGRGIVSRSQGRETLVVTPGTEQFHGMLQFQVLRDGITGEEVMELRRAIETFAVGLAARRRTDADLASLGEAYSDMRGARRDFDFHDADVRFHNQLAVASRNRPLIMVYEGIEALIREVRFRTGAGRRAAGASFEEVLVHHQRILEAVALGDGGAAETAMNDHLNQVDQDLASYRSIPRRRSSGRA